MTKKRRELVKVVVLSVSYSAILLAILLSTMIDNPFIQVIIICAGIGAGWWIIGSMWKVGDGKDS